MRRIDADELKKDIEQWFVKDKYYTNRLHNKIPKTEVFDVIDNAPTVELAEEQAIDKLYETGWIIRHDKEMTERPQGKWIYTPNIQGLSEYEGITCSVCGDDSIGDFNFCPNCGARMVKGGENE